MAALGPEITFVLEWDNPHIYSDDAIEHRALARVAEELATLGRAFELLVAFDARDGESLAPFVARYLAPFAPRLLPLTGGRYYEMKNAGFDAARGDVIVLCDSDCEPEPGAFRAIVDALDGDARQVVGGAPYIDPRSFRGRVWSVISVFPPRSALDDVRPFDVFFANLVAFRREVVARHRFPEQARMRTQCVELSQRLAANGITVWRAGAARTRHAAPDRLRHFVQRAVWHAYDLRGLHSAPRALLSLGATNVRRLRKLLAQRRALGIARAEVPLVALMLLAFGALELSLLLLTVVHPRMPRWAA
jgi:Glycosyl transferase family 2